MLSLPRLRASIDLSVDPATAFSLLVDELTTALAQQGLHVDPGPNGRVVDHGVEVGRVVSWQPGRQILIEWRQADWKPDELTKVEIRFRAASDGTRVTLRHDDWGSLLSDQGGELAGWFSSQVLAPLFQATAPARFGDWLTDRGARRPSGVRSRGVYRDPTHHRPNFLAILSALTLKPEDHLLEVGCGGGVLLQKALETGCKAAGVDHSPEMVKLALEQNREAVSDGRLQVREAEADKLPFPDGTFTCAAMTNVFGFLANPVGVLAEIRRVLAPKGRIAVFTLGVEMKGTMAAPEPMASRLHFYEDNDLEEMARKAGFVKVRVEHPDLGHFAREAKLPEDVVAVFTGGQSDQLLLASC
jgi:SAM-dependent methyltransferase